MRVLNDKKELEELYNLYRSAYKIAELKGVNPKTVYARLKEYDIQTISTQGARIHFYNESYFENIDTEEKAYWLGFIYADGCVYLGSKGNSYRLQINLKEDDIDHLSKFQKAIGSSYGIGHSDKTKSVSLKINSTKMCIDLMHHGVVVSKSLTIEFPHLDNSLVRHFIRGYFDGDGSISWLRGRIPKFSICTGSQAFSDKLKEYLPKCNCYIYKRKNNLYSLETQSRANVKEIYDLLYNNSNIFLDRKYKRYTEIVNIYCPPSE